MILMIAVVAKNVAIHQICGIIYIINDISVDIIYVVGYITVTAVRTSASR